MKESPEMHRPCDDDFDDRRPDKRIRVPCPCRRRVE